jgi:hypothetical protein
MAEYQVNATETGDAAIIDLDHPADAIRIACSEIPYVVRDLIAIRLEYLRTLIHEERISYGELAELQSLSDHIADGDVELLEWAGVSEEDARNAGRI